MTQNTRSQISTQINSGLVLLVSCIVILMGPFISSLIDAESRVTINAIQSDFFVDATYYFHLGGEINKLTASESYNLWEAIAELSPNKSTMGIVYFSCAVRLMVDSIQSGALIFSTILVVLMIHLRKTGVLIRYSEFFLISGLLPYLYIPSKECLFLIGMLVFLTRYSIKQSLLPTVIGSLLMFAARPEGFIILFAAIILARVMRARKIIRAALLVAIVGLYFGFIRENLITITTVYEISTAHRQLAFCSIGPINVCVRDAAFFEQVVISRVFVSLFIYVDWLLDFLQFAIAPQNFSNGDALIRIFNVLHLPIFLAAVFGAWRLRNIDATWTVYFPISYFVVFSGVLFFQGSRQVLFVTVILFLLTRLNPKIIQSFSA
jgi:hypothetical protein